MKNHSLFLSSLPSQRRLKSSTKFNGGSCQRKCSSNNETISGSNHSVSVATDSFHSHNLVNCSTLSPEVSCVRSVNKRSNGSSSVHHCNNDQSDERSFKSKKTIHSVGLEKIPCKWNAQNEKNEFTLQQEVDSLLKQLSDQELRHKEEREKCQSDLTFLNSRINFLKIRHKERNVLAEMQRKKLEENQEEHFLFLKYELERTKRKLDESLRKTKTQESDQIQQMEQKQSVIQSLRIQLTEIEDLLQKSKAKLSNIQSKHDLLQYRVAKWNEKIQVWFDQLNVYHNEGTDSVSFCNNLKERIEMSISMPQLQEIVEGILPRDNDSVGEGYSTFWDNEGAKNGDRLVSTEKGVVGQSAPSVKVTARSNTMDSGSALTWKKKNTKTPNLQQQSTQNCPSIVLLSGTTSLPKTITQRTSIQSPPEVVSSASVMYCQKNEVSNRLATKIEEVDTPHLSKHSTLNGINMNEIQVFQNRASITNENLLLQSLMRARSYSVKTVKKNIRSIVASASRAHHHRQDCFSSPSSIRYVSGSKVHGRNEIEYTDVSTCLKTDTIDLVQRNEEAAWSSVSGKQAQTVFMDAAEWHDEELNTRTASETEPTFSAALATTEQERMLTVYQTSIDHVFQSQSQTGIPVPSLFSSPFFNVEDDIPLVIAAATKGRKTVTKLENEPGKSEFISGFHTTAGAGIDNLKQFALTLDASDGRSTALTNPNDCERKRQSASISTRAEYFELPTKRKLDDYWSKEKKVRKRLRPQPPLRLENAVPNETLSTSLPFQKPAFLSETDIPLEPQSVQTSSSSPKSVTINVLTDTPYAKQTLAPSPLQNKKEATDKDAKNPVSPTPVTTPLSSSRTTEKDTALSPTEKPYKYQETVRCRKARRVLPGHVCSECSAFINAVCGAPGGEVFDRQEMIMECSRHRARHTPPSTPPGFWELSFPDERGRCENEHWP